jgi:hypothetical protein
MLQNGIFEVSANHCRTKNIDQGMSFSGPHKDFCKGPPKHHFVKFGSNSIGPVVSEEIIQIWNANDNTDGQQTQSDDNI